MMSDVTCIFQVPYCNLDRVDSIEQIKNFLIDTSKLPQLRMISP